MDESKLKHGLTAEWFKNWLLLKYTCPTLDVDSVTPPRMMTNKKPPKSNIPNVPIILFFTVSNSRGVIFIINHAIPPVNRTMTSSLNRINPTDTLAIASFGESR